MAFQLQELTRQQHVKAVLGAQALSAWRLYRLRAVWATWSDRAAEMAAERADMQTVVNHWRNRTLAKAFALWQDEVVRSHNLEALLAPYNGKERSPTLTWLAGMAFGEARVHYGHHLYTHSHVRVA